MFRRHFQMVATTGADEDFCVVLSFSGFFKQRISDLWVFTTGHRTGVGFATELRFSGFF